MVECDSKNPNHSDGLVADLEKKNGPHILVNINRMENMARSIRVLVY